MTQSARAKFIDTATQLFSERGYYGVSLADVADALGLTKQSVIYHFKTKEALYGAVLAAIAERLSGVTDDLVDAPQDRLPRFLDRLNGYMVAHPRDAQLIMRELLDNPTRAGTSKTWYLRAFLDAAVGVLENTPGWQDSRPEDRMAATYQMIGAVNYFAISEPTLPAIWGEYRFRKMAKAFLPELKRRAGSL